MPLQGRRLSCGVRPNRSASSLIDLPARYGAATALVVENRARLGSASRLAAGLALMPMWPWPPIDEWSRHTGPGEDELIRDEFAVRMRTSMHKLDGRRLLPSRSIQASSRSSWVVPRSAYSGSPQGYPFSPGAPEAARHIHRATGRTTSPRPSPDPAIGHPVSAAAAAQARDQRPRSDTAPPRHSAHARTPKQARSLTPRSALSGRRKANESSGTFSTPVAGQTHDVAISEGLAEGTVVSPSRAPSARSVAAEAWLARSAPTECFLPVPAGPRLQGDDRVPP